jgi:prevent-host-death family protein
MAETLPCLGDINDELAQAVSGGQPGLVTVAGKPAAVLLDLDTYEEVLTALSDLPAAEATL